MGDSTMPIELSGADAVAARLLDQLDKIVDLLAGIDQKLDATLGAPAQMLTLREAAAILGLAEPSVQYHVQERNLRGIKRGHKWYFTESAVQELRQRLASRPKGRR